MKPNLSNLANYPHKELYRLVVDGFYHDKFKENGWEGYENRQPGCLKAVFDAMSMAITNLEEKKLSLELVLNLHKLITTNVNKLHPEVKPGLVRDEMPVGFSLNSLSVSEKGLCEIFDDIESGKIFGVRLGPPISLSGAMKPVDEPIHNNQVLDPDKTISQSTIKSIRKAYHANDNTELAKKIYPHINNYRYIGPYVKARFLKDLMSNLIDEYNKEIKNSVTLQDKQKIIIDLICGLEHLHPFRDANIRTFVIVLLIRLSIQNDIQIATFEQPNIFDGFSKNEIRLKWNEAIDVTNKIINGEKIIFNFNSAAIPSKSQESYGNIINNFVSKIAHEIKGLEGTNKKRSCFQFFALFSDNKEEAQLLPKNKFTK
jgi:hypothetical protein